MAMKFILLVAVLGVVAGVELGRRRRDRFLREVVTHQSLAKIASSRAELSAWVAEQRGDRIGKLRKQIEAETDQALRERDQEFLDRSTRLRDEAITKRDLCRDNARYHRSISEKYGRASWFFLIPIPPDPPEPPLPTVQTARGTPLELIPRDPGHSPLPPKALEPSKASLEPAETP